jgi:hypothetical protein
MTGGANPGFGCPEPAGWFPLAGSAADDWPTEDWVAEDWVAEDWLVEGGEAGLRFPSA